MGLTIFEEWVMGFLAWCFDLGLRSGLSRGSIWLVSQPQFWLHASIWAIKRLDLTDFETLIYLLEGFDLLNGSSRGFDLFVRAFKFGGFDFAGLGASNSLCEGCFCYGSTRCAEGDHHVGLNLKNKVVVEPKIQPRAQSLAQGLMRHFPKIFESQDHKCPK